MANPRLDNAAPSDYLRPIRRAEYDQMVEFGFFVSERIELLDGGLSAVSPQGIRHATVVSRLNMKLAPALLSRAEVRIRSPFAASGDSEPEPDVSVVPPGDYLRDHPGKAFLIVEIADSPAARDRMIKTRLYAICGVPEYWVIDLGGGTIDVYRAPREDRYEEVTRHGRGSTLALQAFPDVTVPTDTLLLG
jgi:Uma2 family endonuclease